MRLRAIVCGLFCLTLIAFWAACAAAAVKLPALFSDNMVLQAGQPLPVWGWAERGEEVEVAIAGQTVKAKAGEDGRWKVVLEKLAGGGPLEMTVKGSSGDPVTLKNILVGEVWVCSGQSNMVWPLGKALNGKEETAAAVHPSIRLFQVARVKAAQPAADVRGAWAECNPKSAENFSAVAYFFGRHLHKELGVPVGLIDSSWGGTAAELWTSRKALEANETLKPLAGQGENSSLYNGMIAPLIPYAIRGVIWYQGESNVAQAEQYDVLFPAMIANWRADWGQGDFPFGFVQIAPFRYGGPDPTRCARLWESQTKTLKNTPNVGMAVTTDIGDVKDIHPTNKQEVGRRLALWALAKVHGRDLVYSGPIYREMQVEGNRIRLRFDHVGGGLISNDNRSLREFTIAEADKKFVAARATIDGDSVLVEADGISNPVAVRFAWREDAEPNLSNREGLPASPFRTDQW
jgi:sialate O-acetylesterase